MSEYSEKWKDRRKLLSQVVIDVEKDILSTPDVTDGPSLDKSKLDDVIDIYLLLVEQYKKDHEFGGKLINNSKRSAIMALAICRVNPFGSNGKGTDSFDICMANEMLALHFASTVCGFDFEHIPEDVIWVTLFNLRYAELALAPCSKGHTDYNLIYWLTSVFRMFELYSLRCSQPGDGVMAKIRSLLNL